MIHQCMMSTIDRGDYCPSAETVMYLIGLFYFRLHISSSFSKIMY